MDSELIRTFGQVTGLGGLALGLVLLIFRNVIRKSIFSTLTKHQSTVIILTILFLTWSVALSGLAAWVYVSYINTQPVKGNDTQTSYFITIESPKDNEYTSRSVYISGKSYTQAKHLYVTVISPTGEKYIEDSPILVSENGIFSGTVKLGNAGIGDNKKYIIQVIGTEKQISTEDLNKEIMPKNVITHSNPVTVARQDS